MVCPGRRNVCSRTIREDNSPKNILLPGASSNYFQAFSRQRMGRVGNANFQGKFIIDMCILGGISGTSRGPLRKSFVSNEPSFVCIPRMSHRVPGLKVSARPARSFCACPAPSRETRDCRSHSNAPFTRLCSGHGSTWRPTIPGHQRPFPLSRPLTGK